MSGKRYLLGRSDPSTQDLADKAIIHCSVDDQLLTRPIASPFDVDGVKRMQNLNQLSSSGVNQIKHSAALQRLGFESTAFISVRLQSLCIFQTIAIVITAAHRATAAHTEKRKHIC